jgi:3'(2'), 5'-bisphosphate nucleotidase
MTSIDPKEALRVALEATQSASELCQRVQSTVRADALEKRDKSPVTVADFGSQAIIARALKQAFPQIPLIAEEDSVALRSPENAECARRVLEEVSTQLAAPELRADELYTWIDHGSASDYSELFWTLDPIDGTKGFLRGEQYAIALALVRHGTPVIATLACPNLPNASGSKGAVLVAHDGVAESVQADGGRVPVSVSNAANPADARFCESVESAHSDHDKSVAIASALGITRESVRMDSQAKYAAVARGDAEIYLRLPTRADYVERIWDHAAGYAVLAAAGGRITDIDGKDLDFRCGKGLDENRGIVATNGPFHDALLAAIASAGV